MYGQLLRRGGGSEKIESRENEAHGSGLRGLHTRLTRRKVLYRRVELTGVGQAATLFAGKIDRSAEAFRNHFPDFSHIQKMDRRHMCRG
jgi:hypothetical protein